ncbi:MAG: PRC-barrel domain-containing protein [Microcystaceae cyanobacterium]
MTTDNIRLRNEFINTQVITRNTGKKLGVVKEILVDVDQREVVAFGLRDNMLALSGMCQYLYLENVSQTGDVILVEDEDVIESVEVDLFSPLVNCEVITEAGEPLGRVRDFQFDSANGKVISIVIASFGLPQIPEQLLSTYELSIEEVVSSGPNRLIVFEGAEERLSQVSVGVLERLGIGRPPWEKDAEDMYYPPTAKPENQLGTGIPVRTPVRTRQPEPVLEERWTEDEWEQPAPRRAEAMRYDDYEEEDNWGESRQEKPVNYEPQPYAPPKPQPVYSEQEDMWDDDVQPEPYNPPRVNIPEKQKEKSPEYYGEEAG